MPQDSAYGYKGFRTWANQEYPALKPGETRATRAQKFNKMTRSHVQGSSLPVQVGNKGYQTQSLVSFGQIHSHDLKTARQGPKVTERRDEDTHSRPFLGTSTYTQNYCNYSQDYAMRQQKTGDDYAVAFKSVASKNAAHPDAIELNQIEEVLTQAYGKPPSEHEVNLFQKILEGLEEDALQWPAFHNAVKETNDFLAQRAQDTGKSGIPQWLQSSAPPKVLPNRTPASSHQEDFGLYGQLPSDRPYVRKTGMATTTGGLLHGTTRETHHIPGYGGFIPSAGNNPEAVSHGEGLTSRTRGSDIRLYHRDNIPGYTGHKAESCNNYRGEMKTGADLKTTNGDFFAPLQK